MTSSDLKDVWCIVLDLDETLIHSTEECNIEGCNHVVLCADGWTFYLHQRPMLQIFLDYLDILVTNRPDIKLVYFTAGTFDYGRVVLSHVMRGRKGLSCLFHSRYLKKTPQHKHGVKTIEVLDRHFRDGRVRYVTVDDLNIHYPDSSDRDYNYIIPKWRVEMGSVDHALMDFFKVFATMALD